MLVVRIRIVTSKMACAQVRERERELCCGTLRDRDKHKHKGRGERAFHEKTKGIDANVIHIHNIHASYIIPVIGC